MDRRSFLGSVIGTLVSTQLPFIARAANNDPVKETLFYRYQRYLDLPEKKLLDFSGLIQTTENRIWAPPLLNLKNSSSLKFEDLLVPKPFDLISYSLVDDEGFILSTDYKWPSHFSNQDILKLKYSLDDREHIKKVLKNNEIFLNGKPIDRYTIAERVKDA